MSFTFTFTFTAPPATPEVTTYTIYYDEGDTLTNSPQTATFTGGTLNGPYTVSSLKPGTQYVFAISATNSVGEGPRSAPPITRTTTSPATAPGAPTLTAAASNITSNSLDLTIGQPADSGGAAVTSIKVYYTTDGSTPTKSSTSVTFTDLADNTYSLTGLTPATTYKFKASAVNSVGESDLSSAEASATTQATTTTPPGAPTGLAGSESATRGTVNLSWSAPSGGTAVARYRIEHSDDGGSPWRFSKEATSSPTTVTQAAGTTRTYRVFSVAGDGTLSTTAPTVAVTTAGVPPKGPTPQVTTNADTSQVTVTWVLTQAQLTGLTGINVRRLANGVAESATAYGSSQRSHTDRNISRGVRYEYQVQLVNAAGPGVWSDNSRAVTRRGSGGTTPRSKAVSGLTATGGNRLISLAWAAPDESANLRGYTVEVSSTSASSGFTVLASPTTRLLTHHSLPPSTRRWYRVRATYTVGDPGPWSAVVSAVTHADGTGRSAPTAPRSVTATVDGDSVVVRWEAPADSGSARVTGYRVQGRVVGTAAWLALEENTGEGARLYVHRNLPQGTSYEYRVAAINSVGLSNWSGIANAVTDDVPGPPALAAAGLDARIELQWSPPVRTGGTEIVGYRLEVSEDLGLNWITLVETGEHMRGYTHDGLGPGVQRSYRLRARNSVGEGAYSDIVTARTRYVKASMPRDLQARAVGAEVDLVWREPSRLGGGTVQGYRIEISLDGRRWETITTTATGTRYTVTGLPPDVERFFRLAAITEAGVGEYSDAVRVKTNPTVPDPPSVVTALALSTSAISIAWNPPRNTGGRSTALTGYRIEVFRGSEWTVLRSSTRSLETQYTHSGLEPGTEYHYRIRALNRVGMSEPSETVKARTLATIPGPPSHVTVHAEGSDRLRVRWRAPAYDGGGQITGYQIEANRDGRWRVLEPNTRTPNTDYLHVGLEPAERWSYRISAINEAGLGEPSDPGSGETDPTVPDPPTGLHATADGNRIELRWKSPDYTGGSDVIGYRIEASDDDRVSWQMLVRNSNHPGTTFAHEDLPPGTTWHYRVYAINEEGVSRASRQASATTEAAVPGAPADVTATSPDPETVVLTWTAPRETGGAPIKGYRIEYSEDDGVSWIGLEHNTNSTERRYIHRNRTHATVYWYRVYAINRIGVGPSSPEVLVKTQARVPGPPLNLTAAAVTPDVIELAWDPPEHDGGAEIEHYRVEHTLHPEETWELLAESQRSEWKHEGLTPGETHYYRVRAVNSAGGSEPSNVAQATTDDTADRIERLNRTLLPQFASTVASGIVKSVSDRMDALAHNRGGHRRLGSVTGVERDGLQALLNGASTSQSLGSGFAAWGSAEKVLLSDVTDDARWEGEALTLYTGSDVEPRDGLVLGVSASHARGEFDIVDYAWDDTLQADYGTGLSAVTPYIGWMPRQNVTAWTSASYGIGEIKLKQGPAEYATSRMKMLMGAGGLIGRLVSGGSGGLNLRAEAWVARLNVTEADDFRPVELDLRRIRTALEWQRASLMNGGHEFTLMATGGLRHDFHAELTNHTGFEFGGGVGYTSPSRRLRVTGTTRMLVTTDSEYSEWGWGGGLYLDPPPNGGLAVRAEPSYGSHQGGVEQLWSNGVRALLGERRFAAPVSVEYHRDGAKPYLRLAGGRTALGTSYRGISIEGLTGKSPGLGLRGRWTF